MALFMGSWQDGDGVPFDGDAYNPDTWDGGGSAAVRRRRIRPHSGQADFVRAIRSAADHWHHTIDTAARSGWDYEGSLGTTRRGSTNRTPVNGFIQYNAFDAITHYYDPPSNVHSPTEAEPGFHWTSIIDVRSNDQTVGYHGLAVAGLSGFAYARLAVFQIEPNAVLRANPWKATRLIDLLKADDFDPCLFERTAPLAWHVIPGDKVRLFFRGRVASRWGYTDDDTDTAI